MLHARVNFALGQWLHLGFLIAYHFVPGILEIIDDLIAAAAAPARLGQALASRIEGIIGGTLCREEHHHSGIEFGHSLVQTRSLSIYGS